MPTDAPQAIVEPHFDLIPTPLTAVRAQPGTARVTGERVKPAGRLAAAADRLAVARLLVERGPIYGEDAARALGWTAERWWDAAGRCKAWFRLTRTGWVLSGEGRRDVDSGVTAAVSQAEPARTERVNGA